MEPFGSDQRGSPPNPLVTDADGFLDPIAACPIYVAAGDISGLRHMLLSQARLALARGEVHRIWPLRQIGTLVLGSEWAAAHLPLTPRELSTMGMSGMFSGQALLAAGSPSRQQATWGGTPSGQFGNRDPASQSRGTPEPTAFQTMGGLGPRSMQSCAPRPTVPPGACPPAPGRPPSHSLNVPPALTREATRRDPATSCNPPAARRTGSDSQGPEPRPRATEPVGRRDNCAPPVAGSRHGPGANAGGSNLGSRRKGPGAGARKDPARRDHRGSHRAPSTTRRIRNRHQTCPVDGCDYRSHAIRRHVYRHFPECYKPNPNVADSVISARVAGLRYLTETFTGQRRGEIQPLVNFLANRWRKGAGAVTPELEDEMRRMCRVTGWPEKPHFTLQPANSPACLIHYRALAFLYNKLTVKQRAAFEARAHLGSPKRSEGASPAPLSDSAGDVAAPVPTPDGEVPSSHPGVCSPVAEAGHSPLQAAEVQGEEPMETSDEEVASSPGVPVTPGLRDGAEEEGLGVVPPPAPSVQVPVATKVESEDPTPSGGSGLNMASPGHPARPRTIKQVVLKQMARATTTPVSEPVLANGTSPRPTLGHSVASGPNGQTGRVRVSAPVRVVDSHAHLDRLE